MGDLGVTVRLNGVVVDDRVVAVRRMVRVGDAAEARVAFPGADVAAVRMGGCLALRGRLLAEGESMTMSLGHVHVTLEHTVRGSTPHEWRGLFDPRFLVAAVMVVSVGTWVDAAEAWIEREALVSSVPMVRELHSAMEVARDDQARRRAATLPRGSGFTSAGEVSQALADGPRHESDDHLTGMGWYPWYRRAVPDNVEQVAEALASYAYDPDNASGHWMLARAAYDADDFEEAAHHYRWILERYPHEFEARLRLAWTEGRLGHHQAEIALYEEILEQEPQHPYALGGLAVALARMNRLDEAVARFDELVLAAPDLAYTDVVLAMIEAMQGHDTAALEALGRALAAREQLSEELQVEVRRDIAIDPAFASLRRNRRLSILVSAYLWAAGPTPVR